MKKFLLKFEVYYYGNCTHEDDIGVLTLEIVLDEERIKKHRQFIESENDFDIDDTSHHVPVNYTTIYAKSAKVVEKRNIVEEDDTFEFKIYSDEVKLTTRGSEVILQMGYPEPC